MGSRSVPSTDAGIATDRGAAGHQRRTGGEPQPGAAAPQVVRHLLTHPDGRRLWVYGDLHGHLDGTAGRPFPAGPLHRRHDALSDSWVVISPSRNTRPQTHATDAVPLAPTDGGQQAAVTGCPLCPGGPEVPFPYEAAVFENRFPSLVAEAALDGVGQVTGGDVAPAEGRCEVVLYSHQHVGSLATLEPDELGRLVAIWRDRSLALWAVPQHELVLVFENRGEGVGATLSHPHGQIYAFDHVPPVIAARQRAGQRHRERTDSCLHCELVEGDAAGDRVVQGNGSFSVAVPFAARWPYEVHVRARRHGCGRLGDLTLGEQRDLGLALQELVRRYDRLFGSELPYMMVVHEAPRGAADWHLSFEFWPPHRSADKFKVRASVETSTGLFINDTLPETSAALLAGLQVPAPDAPVVPGVVLGDDRLRGPSPARG